MIRFLTRGFRRPSEVVESALGTLERRVLERLWALDTEVTVRELRAAFDGPPAYTTLMTTLDRLYRKGLLERRRAGRAYAYRPKLTREQLRNDVAADVLDSLLGQSAASARPVLSTLLDAIEARDAALLDELDALLAGKKRRRGKVRR